MEIIIKLEVPTGEGLYKILRTIQETGLAKTLPSLTKEDVRDVILSYYKVSLEEFEQNAHLSKDEPFPKIKKFITYFLVKDLDLNPKTIKEFLKYNIHCGNNIVLYNTRYIETMLKNNDFHYVNPYNNLRNLFKSFQETKIR